MMGAFLKKMDFLVSFHVPKPIGNAAEIVLAFLNII